MRPSNEHEKKRQSLKQQRTLNRQAEKVKHTLFEDNDFFDPDDLMQLKYEMLRSVRHNNQSIRQASKDFGLSRVSFYQAKKDFEQQGLVGLLPQKRGPKNPHKLSDDVMAYIKQQMADDSTINSTQISQIVKAKFAKTIHPRTIEKALESSHKKGRQK